MTGGAGKGEMPVGKGAGVPGAPAAAPAEFAPVNEEVPSALAVAHCAGVRFARFRGGEQIASDRIANGVCYFPGCLAFSWFGVFLTTSAGEQIVSDRGWCVLGCLAFSCIKAFWMAFIRVSGRSLV